MKTPGMGNKHLLSYHFQIERAAGNRPWGCGRVPIQVDVPAECALNTRLADRTNDQFKMIGQTSDAGNIPIDNSTPGIEISAGNIRDIVNIQIETGRGIGISSRDQRILGRKIIYSDIHRFPRCSVYSTYYGDRSDPTKNRFRGQRVLNEIFAGTIDG